MKGGKELILPATVLALVVSSCFPAGASNQIDALPTYDPGNMLTDEQMAAIHQERVLRQTLYDKLIEAGESPDQNIQEISLAVGEDVFDGYIPVTFDSFNEAAVAEASIVMSPEDHSYFRCIFSEQDLSAGYLISFNSDEFANLQATAIVGYIYQCQVTLMRLAYEIPLEAFYDRELLLETVKSLRVTLDTYSWFLMASMIGEYSPESFPSDDDYFNRAVELIEKLGTEDYEAFAIEFERGS